MNRTTLFVAVGSAALALLAGSLTLTLAQDPPDMPPGFELPPGWTMEDMMAFAEAGTPGEMHKHLAEAVGTWRAQTTMWMGPGTEPMRSGGRSTAETMMDGRFVKVEMTGAMPGMGPYNGFGIYGYDNVAKQFQSVWIDNHGTGMMIGTGELASDGKTLTWTYNYTCPITKKPTAFREIEHIIDEDTRKLEMHGIDPKSGEEYKMMEIEMTRTKGDRTKRSSTR